jgi:hypothetical protein
MHRLKFDFDVMSELKQSKSMSALALAARKVLLHGASK